MVLTIRSVAKSLRSVHPRFMETVTLTSALFNSRQDFLSRCERDFSCLRSDRNLSYKERLTSGIAGIKKDDAVHLFHSMLRSRPLPTVIDFNKLFKAVAKTSLSKQMEFNGVAFELYTLNITKNCFCRLRKLGLASMMLGIYSLASSLSKE
ncbi:hypothetical protein YC2023_100778 [Brassica napus]